MKRHSVLIVAVSAAVLFAGPLVAHEECSKEIVSFDPPPGSYKQISPEEARHMKNATSSDEKEACIALERVPDKTEDKYKK